MGRPRSMGRILFNASAPTLEAVDRTVVDYNLFSDETDYDVFVEGKFHAIILELSKNDGNLQLFCLNRNPKMQGNCQFRSIARSRCRFS